MTQQQFQPLPRQQEFLELDGIHVAERAAQTETLPGEMDGPLDLRHAGNDGDFIEMASEIGQPFGYTQTQHHAFDILSLA